MSITSDVTCAAPTRSRPTALQHDRNTWAVTISARTAPRLLRRVSAGSPGAGERPPQKTRKLDDVDPSELPSSPHSSWRRVGPHRVLSRARCNLFAGNTSVFCPLPAGWPHTPALRSLDATLTRTLQLDLREQLQSTLGSAYTLDRELGGGGMSRVFVARDEALGRDVVVKVLSPDLVQSLSATRFTREIKLVAALQEPHIVPVLHAGETADGLPFYTMPFVRGESLRTRLQEGLVPRAEALTILRDVGRALDYAHRHGVVHRDIKPENILLSSGTAMVTDFGIAKALQSSKMNAPGGTLTEIGTSLGTPAYMAPEQALGETVDHRADVYSWGVVAYELLAGRHPFEHRSTGQQLVAAHISEQPASLAGRKLGLSPALAALVMRCLAKNPDDRPQSAADMLIALDRLGAERSRATLTAILALSSAAVVLIAVAVTKGHRGIRREEPSGARSVGVVRFSNLSGDTNNAYFSEGVTQEITDALSKVPGLRVASQATSAAAAPDARVLGRALGVETVLLGSVQRAGERVRISARLVNTNDGFQIWSDKYDRDVKDVFALQDDIARAIANGLKLRLTTGAADTLVRVATTDPEAHNLYLQGMYFWNLRGTAMIHKSIDYFRRAIARDSGYSRAYSGLALAYAVLTTYEDVNVPQTLDSATTAASKALALDSGNADAYAAIGEARAQLWQHLAADSAFERAIALDSNNARARQWYAEKLAARGRTTEASRQIYRAQQLEPLNLIINANVGRVELLARRYDRAEAALRHTLELDSTQRTARALLAAVYLQQGKPDRAIAEFQRAMVSGSNGSTTALLLAHAYLTAGRRDDAQRILVGFERRRAANQSVSYAGLALVYDGIGQRERALALLDTAVRRFDQALAMHSREAIFDPLRRDPRGAAIFARAEGLP